MSPSNLDQIQEADAIPVKHHKKKKKKRHIDDRSEETVPENHQNKKRKGSDGRSFTAQENQFVNDAEANSLGNQGLHRVLKCPQDPGVRAPWKDIGPEREKWTSRKGYDGRRFTPEEDQLIKDAVYSYIEANQLGDQGVQRVLNCRQDPGVTAPWKYVGAWLPWRPIKAVYNRAHSLFMRSANRKWEPHEYETLLRLHKIHGSNWKIIAKELGKYARHVHDMWRRISRTSGLNNGRWSQEEYQKLFNLVNMDLRTSAFQEKTKRRVTNKNNIPWEAIGDKMSTRHFSNCCLVWYNQLSSSLVKEGVWLDKDDYRMMDQLQKSDACCVEEVDWDNLLAHRSGDICRKRWDQMVRHIGGHKERSFLEQLDVLGRRYCTEMLDYVKDEGRSDATPPSSGSSIPEQTRQDGELQIP